MTTCNNPAQHEMRVPMVSGVFVTVRHGQESDAEAIVPCIDFVVNDETGAAIGALISMEDNDGAPWGAFGASGNYIADYPDIIRGAEAVISDRLGTDQIAACAYSSAHWTAHIRAVTVLDCGAAGIVSACQACADFYSTH